MQLLKSGQTLTAHSSGLTYRIEEFLGGGGQGEVYKASLSTGAVALKWYFPYYLAQDPRLQERLTQAIHSGPPSDRFLWPLELVTAAGTPGFGYIMPLREPRFRGMADLMMRRVTPSFRALATAGFELSHSYLQLHARGLCYRDISFGNVFFDPATGQVQICDNDNVDVDGQPGGIGGTARFMAPELVRGEATPSTQTDLYSLAVLLFYLLVNHHPLEGAQEAAIRCFDLPAMTRLYGTHPCFIFDPADTRNRPLPTHHDNALAFWPLYPEFLRAIFTRAFTLGVRDPGQRVRESEWRAVLVRLRDSLFYCDRCGAENCHDPARLQTAGTPGSCWACGTALQLPPRIRIQRATDSQLVMLNADSRLYPHHVDDRQPYDFRAAVARVVQHPSRPRLWGLQNQSDQRWVAITAGGTVQDVDPGRSVTLADGTRVRFDSSEGEIRC